MRNVIIGFLGTQLDMGKNRAWRPSVDLTRHDHFPVDRFELIHDQRYASLANRIVQAIGAVSPDTEVRLVQMDMRDPWDVNFHAELTRVFHRELTRLKVMVCGFYAGVKTCEASFFFRAAAAELALKRKLSFPVSRM